MIDKQRLYEELKELGEIGFQQDAGTTRTAYSQAFFQGRDYVQNRMKEAGLKTEIDSIGNLTGLWEGERQGGKKILVGSHIDSVPGGGIFDGCLGVLSAVECVRALKREGFQPFFPIEIVAFIEEEGNAIGGTFGSRCFTGGAVTEEEREKAKKFGVNAEDIRQAARKPEDYQAYLELHIEQGGILEAEEKEIGIVEGIVGIARYHGTVLGEANHAGTTPMELRDDAMMKSVEILQDLYHSVLKRKNGMVCTVGDFHIPKPAANVIPGQTEFLLEGRYRQLEVLSAFIEEWKRKYEEEGLKLELFLQQKETLMDKEMLFLWEKICQREGLTWKSMYSGAGHDAMNLAGFTATGMIFIPSKGGISHSIKENSSMEEVAKGTQVLYQMIKELAACRP